MSLANATMVVGNGCSLVGEKDGGVDDAKRGKGGKCSVNMSVKCASEVDLGGPSQTRLRINSLRAYFSCASVELYI